uniref:F-box domain-containing protein n=1 Tax=Setaria italica TaxID=4555 RepID=K3ZZ75_SETIT
MAASSATGLQAVGYAAVHGERGPRRVTVGRMGSGRDGAPQVGASAVGRAADRRRHREEEEVGASPPELIDDAVAEILLRIPPDEPADLFRASLVCKPWLRVASDPAFLRRYRAFHRGAPLLGFFYCAPAYDDHNWSVRGCRHCGVVLMKSFRKFAVWDLITGHQEELPKLDIRWMFDITRAAVIGDEIYCIVDLGSGILKYDLVEHCFSFMNLPAVYEKRPLLMQNEDGSLGFAGVSHSRLYLWSRMKVIKLKILPKANVFGFAEGAGVFLMSTNAGAFMFELKSGQVKKVGERMDYRTFFPFNPFSTAAQNDRWC